jgi:Leucine-rich repeat (LRR) protein
MGAATVSTVKQVKFDLEDKILTQKVSEINAEIAEEIKQTGALVLPLAQNNNYIEINYINNSKLTDNEAVGRRSAVLSKAPEQTLWLKLSNTNITDETLVEVAKLKNLTRLHLEKTQITDNGLIQLKPLQNLEYLNLTGTQISDAGLQTLATIKSLKKIYLWQTKVSKAGVEKLKKALPNLVVELGFTENQITAYLKTTKDTISDDVYKKK